MSVTIQVGNGGNAFAELAKDLDNAAEILGRAEYRAINKVAVKAMTRSRREITSQVALTDTYVRDRMNLSQARADNPVAVITARSRPTTLSTYGAKVVTSAAPKAKGDARRGIPAGRKSLGVAVGVKKGGGRKLMRGAFVLPLKAGKEAGGNGMGVFVKPKGGPLKHLYGPSVDQVFKGVSRDIAGEVADDLEKTVADQTEYEVRKALKL